MSKKKFPTSGIVYSTDPGFNPLDGNELEQDTPAPGQQHLRIRLETKHRAGKTVTLIEGFIGKFTDKEALIKKLKSHCGTGGSAKDGELIIQGDQRDKVYQWLLKAGYVSTKRM